MMTMMMKPIGVIFTQFGGHSEKGIFEATGTASKEQPNTVDLISDQTAKYMAQ